MSSSVRDSTTNLLPHVFALLHPITYTSRRQTACLARIRNTAISNTTYNMHMLGTCLKLPYHYTILYHLYTAKVWMSLSPQNVNAEILMPSMIALGDKALGRWLGSWGCGTQEWDQCPIKEDLERFLTPSTLWGQHEKSETCKRALTQPCWPLILGFQPLNCEKWSSVAYTPPAWEHVHAQSLRCGWLFAIPHTVAYSALLVHGISWVKTLKWVAISFSRGSSQPPSPSLAGGSLPQHQPRRHLQAT